MRGHRFFEALVRVAEYCDFPLDTGQGTIANTFMSFVVWHRGAWCEVDAHYDEKKDEILVRFKGQTPIVMKQFTEESK